MTTWDYDLVEEVWVGGRRGLPIDHRFYAVDITDHEEEEEIMEQVDARVEDEVHERLRELVAAAAVEDPIGPTTNEKGGRANPLEASEALMDDLLAVGILGERRAWTTAAGSSVVNVGCDLRELVGRIGSSVEDQRRALVLCAHDWARRRALPHVEVSLHFQLHPDHPATETRGRDTIPIVLDERTEASFPGYARVKVIASEAAWIPVGDGRATNRCTIDFPRWRGPWSGGDIQTILAAATHERTTTNKGRAAEIVEPARFDDPVRLMDPMSLRLRPRTVVVSASALTAKHPFRRAEPGRR